MVKAKAIIPGPLERAMPSLREIQLRKATKAAHAWADKDAWRAFEALLGTMKGHAEVRVRMHCVHCLSYPAQQFAAVPGKCRSVAG